MAEKPLLTPLADTTEVKVDERIPKTGFVEKESEEDINDFFAELEGDIEEAQREGEKRKWYWIVAVAGIVVSMGAFCTWYLFYIKHL